MAAFVYVVAICLWEKHANLTDALSITAYMVVFTSILGVIKAILMWIPYRWKKIQLHSVTRVAITSLATGLLALTTGYLFGTGRLDDMGPWVLILLLGGLPTAILIGSKVKPWKLFTFGSIAGQQPRTVLGTLATLPLRFLSLSALAVWILSFACQRELDDRISEVAAALSVPLIYFLISAYLTFESPRKSILLVIGLVVNLPVACFAFFAYLNYHYANFAPATLFDLSVICTIFVAAWMVFLAARLSVPTPRIPTTDLSEALLIAHEKRNHECLGSRFVEWEPQIASAFRTNESEAT